MTINPPRALMMDQDVVLDPMNLQHGRGGIWCLDCHHSGTCNKLVDSFGNEISFNQPQELCGKCHGPIYRDWRGGIHGKRRGEWANNGKKRGFVCTECHNPHDVQQGARERGFAQLQPERAPNLPKGIYNTDREKQGAYGSGYGKSVVHGASQKAHPQDGVFLRVQRGRLLGFGAK